MVEPGGEWGERGKKLNKRDRLLQEHIEVNIEVMEKLNIPAMMEEVKGPGAATHSPKKDHRPRPVIKIAEPSPETATLTFAQSKRSASLR